MFEKVNPCHPDKLCDRIAGALVDLAYALQDEPKIAVEVMLGHGRCFIIAESSVELDEEDVFGIVYRISGRKPEIDFIQVNQDVHLSDNQADGFRCGDNGIFRGVPVTEEQKTLTSLARKIYKAHPTDGKYILDGNRLIICQSNAADEQLQPLWPTAEINPLGFWTGGTDVDTGATNRKLGSDMGDSVTGGGLHGKDRKGHEARGMAQGGSPLRAGAVGESRDHTLGFPEKTGDHAPQQILRPVQQSGVP